MSTTTTETRSLGAGGRQLSAVGVGTWALGGPFTFDGRDAGWGEVDDAESIRALHTAIDAGVTLIDTAPAYGTGHSERVIGQALAALPTSAREAVAVATKFGLPIDESRRTGGGNDVRPEAIRAECEASLRRLELEAVDVYQLHGGAETVAVAEDVVATCEELLAEGKIRSFGTAQDDAETVAVFARSDRCVSVQTQANIFGWTQATLDAAHAHGWAVLARSPLAMGMLSGKYDTTNRPKTGDVRLDTPWWDYFDTDTMPGWLHRLDTVRELLTVGGRTLVQGALGYLLALDPSIIPLPGIRTEQQARENSSVLTLGPLPQAETAEITALLADSPERR
jgi:aryl-alcohol dehydrogenase-like predicted oxidoreductase